MAKIDFAPDGIHYQTVKDGSLEWLWDYFIKNANIREQLIINPFGRFRLVGEHRMIGVLAYDPKRKEFQHLEAE
ncbi:MAG: hypothetical protein JW804_00600 [Sedimentisphaerales bacterium]|nr:hypothetical protein [Sedimentisphaerales bacterium]